ncbi:MAG: hypothetical protein ACI9V1_001800, partial [Spirosomataceae bacterium]
AGCYQPAPWQKARIKSIIDNEKLGNNQSRGEKCADTGAACN